VLKVDSKPIVEEKGRIETVNAVIVGHSILC
jgi:hypothetical protein